MPSRFDDDEPTQKHKGPASAPKVLELVAAAARQTAEELSTAMAPMSFVGPRPPDNDDDDWSFRTASLRTVRENIGGSEVIVDEAFLVHPIKKTKPGPFANTVLIGRSGSNDMSVLHSSVSKLHARVAIKPDGMYLSDAGSSNGTTINGRRLKASEELRLVSGDLVLFGACHYVVLDAASLHGILVRFGALGP